MTVDDRRIFEFLDGQAGHAQPDYLDDILTRTARTRQRPAWTSIERWLPVDITAQRSGLGRPVPWRSLAVFVALAVLVAALVAVAVASRRALPAPYGLAQNGAVVASINGDILAVDAGTWKTRPLIQDDKFDFSPVFSRDGTKMLFLQSDTPIGQGPDPKLTLAVADADGSHVRAITSPMLDLGWFDWSPDGSRIVFIAVANGRSGVIHVANADGTGVTAIGDVELHAHYVTWLPPDGREIVFRSEPEDGSTDGLGLFAVHPDGSGLRPLSVNAPTNESDYQSMTVSPDGSTLSFTRWLEDGRPRVYLLDVRSGVERELPTPGRLAQRGGGTFSPDGRLVAYERIATSGEFQAVVAPADGSSTGVVLGPKGQGLPDGSDTGLTLAFSPDGSALMERLGGDDNGTFWWVPLDGSPASIIGAGAFNFVDVQRLAR